MNVLILSFKAGEGHNSAAKAILERVEHEGHTGEVVDFLGLFSDKISNAVNVSYVSTAKHAPALFGALYNLSLAISRRIHGVHSAIYLDSVIVSKKLREYLEAHPHYDAIVATHLMPAQALAHLKKHEYPLPVTIAVATDYTCYPFWEEAAACDYYVIPHEELIPEYVRRGIPAEKLCPFGIPTGMRFQSLPSHAEARAHLGFAQDASIYLVMGGSMGAGQIRKFARRFSRYLGDAHMVIICGKNDALRQTLEKDFAEHPNLHIVGFTTEVHLYMVACDVLYTKPGGLTSSEALICRVPMVHTKAIPGCETDNLRFFGSHGCSLPAKNPVRQIYSGLRLMRSSAMRDRMRQAQAACAKPNASLDILRLIEKHQIQE